MDLDRIAKAQLAALLRLLDWMLVRFGKGMDFETHLELLRTIRAVESSARRLVVVAARALAVKVRLQVGAKGKKGEKAEGREVSERPLSFSLLDPRKYFPELDILLLRRRRKPKCEARIIDFWFDDPVPQPPPKRVPKAPLNAAKLGKRMQTVRAVLNDLPKYALRLARWRARQKLRAEADLLHISYDVMRPGWPPGHAIDGKGDAHLILRECQSIALWAEEERRAV